MLSISLKLYVRALTDILVTCMEGQLGDEQVRLNVSKSEVMGSSILE